MEHECAIDPWVKLAQAVNELQIISCCANDDDNKSEAYYTGKDKWWCFNFRLSKLFLFFISVDISLLIFHLLIWIFGGLFPVFSNLFTNKGVRFSFFYNLYHNMLYFLNTIAYKVNIPHTHLAINNTYLISDRLFRGAP